LRSQGGFGQHDKAMWNALRRLQKIARPGLLQLARHLDANVRAEREILVLVELDMQGRRIALSQAVFDDGDPGGRAVIRKPDRGERAAVKASVLRKPVARMNS
jgi:hypothetical protein